MIKKTKRFDILQIMTFVLIWLILYQPVGVDLTKILTNIWTLWLSDTELSHKPINQRIPVQFKYRYKDVLDKCS